MRTKKALELNAAERERLENFISSGTAKAREIKPANVILKLSQNWKYRQIAEAFDLTKRTIIRIKQRFEWEGIFAALVDKPRSGAPSKIDGDGEALIVAITCTDAPEGHAHWTLCLLADKVVELGLVESVSHVTIGDILKKRIEAVAGAELVYSTLEC